MKGQEDHLTMYEGASSKLPWEEACYAGVDWSCVNLVWEYCLKTAE